MKTIKKYFFSVLLILVMLMTTAGNYYTGQGNDFKLNVSVSENCDAGKYTVSATPHEPNGWTLYEVTGTGTFSSSSPNWSVTAKWKKHVGWGFYQYHTNSASGTADFSGCYVRCSKTVAGQTKEVSRVTDGADWVITWKTEWLDKKDGSWCKDTTSTTREARELCEWDTATYADEEGCVEPPVYVDCSQTEKLKTPWTPWAAVPGTNIEESFQTVTVVDKFDNSIVCMDPKTNRKTRDRTLCVNTVKIKGPLGVPYPNPLNPAEMIADYTYVLVDEINPQHVCKEGDGTETTGSNDQLPYCSVNNPYGTTEWFWAGTAIPEGYKEGKCQIWDWPAKPCLIGCQPNTGSEKWDDLINPPAGQMNVIMTLIDGCNWWWNYVIAGWDADLVENQRVYAILDKPFSGIYGDVCYPAKPFGSYWLLNAPSVDMIWIDGTKEGSCPAADFEESSRIRNNGVTVKKFFSERGGILDE